MKARKTRQLGAESAAQQYLHSTSKHSAAVMSAWDHQCRINQTEKMDVENNILI
jgi:hypothetical protein